MNQNQQKFMQRTKQVNSKTLNDLGITYQKARKGKQQSFKGALLVLSNRDEIDYWRAFREVWQYSDKLGRAPSAITATAYNELGFDFSTLTVTAK